MRNLKITLVAALLAAAFAMGCDKPGDENRYGITVRDTSTLDQTLYADETACADIDFTTLGAWTSTIESPGANTKAAPDWISVSPSSGDKAGDYMMEITLTANTTGKTRNAVITIFYGGDNSIDVKIEQRLVNKGGLLPKSYLEDMLDDLDGMFGNLAGAYNALDDNYSTQEARNAVQPTTKALYDLWKSAYALIDDCNLLLDIIDLAEDMSAIEKDIYKAHAQRYRGMSYFFLTTMFGSVPLAVDVENSAASLPRHPDIEDIRNQIRADFEYAVAFLTAGDKAVAMFSFALYSLQSQRISEAAIMFNEIVGGGDIAVKDTNGDGLFSSDDGSETIMAVAMYLLAAEANAKMGNTTYAVANVNTLCEILGRAHALTSASTADNIMNAAAGMFSGWNAGLKFINTARWNDLSAWGDRALLPIPQQAMDENSLLTQNPGW